MSEENEVLSFHDGVRKRPGMYLGGTGGKGIINLFCGLIKECILLSNSDRILFSIDILGNGKFSLQIKSDVDFSAIVQHLSNEQWDKEILHLKVLQAVTNELEVLVNKDELLLNFHLDNAVFNDTSITYLNLVEKLYLVALLNPKTVILIKDITQKYANQNYLSFPDGIFYLYRQTIEDVLGKPKFEIFYEGQVEGNNYQIALAYRTDWFPTPSVICFANDILTSNGGTLVEGVLEGLITACRKYVKDNNLSTYKIKRKKFYNGLIIVCAVRGGDFDFEGAFKERLASREIKVQARKIMYRVVTDYLNDNKESCDKFLWRFDETQMTRYVLKRPEN